MINLSTSLPQTDLWPFTRVNVHCKKGNDKTFDNTELTLIPGDPKCHCGLPVRVGVYGGQVINEALCWVYLTVGPVCP